MSDDRRPLWPWIVALLIGLPVLYVASFGPACWLADRYPSVWIVVWKVYYPLAEVTERGSARLSNALMEYGVWDSWTENVPIGVPVDIPIAVELTAEASIRNWRRAHD